MLVTRMTEVTRANDWTVGAHVGHPSGERSVPSVEGVANPRRGRGWCRSGEVLHVVNGGRELRQVGIEELRFTCVPRREVVRQRRV